MPADNTDLSRRQREMATYLHQTATMARQMAVSLTEAASAVNGAEANADDVFAEGLLSITNFMQNLRLQQAVKLAARYAAAEMKYILEG